jgi:SPP1 gp7 family putative phage head morphogenesis protein
MANPQAELEELFRHSLGSIEGPIDRVISATINGQIDEKRDALDALAEVVTEAMTVVHIQALDQVLREASAATGQAPEGTVFLQSNPLFSGGFNAVLENLINRIPRGITPELIQSLGLDDVEKKRQAMEAVKRLYRDQFSFAVARSAKDKITARVQDLITEGLRTGQPITKASEAIEKMTGWKGNYARTVYRTNLNTAYTAGRVEALSKPLVKRAIPAVRFVTANDDDVRDGSNSDENHAAMQGVMGAIDDPGWDQDGGWFPPLGYNCRCIMRGMGYSEAVRRGAIDKNGRVKPVRIPQGAAKEPGFGARPRNKPIS